MDEDMSELFDKLNDMLNSDSSNDLKNLISSLKNENSDSSSSESSHNSSSDASNNNFNIDFETIMKIKQIIDALNTKKDDPRANLLMSLKPYLKESRKEKLDQYVQILNMSSIFELLKKTGGDLNAK